MTGINIEALDWFALGWCLLCWIVYAQLEVMRPGISKEIEGGYADWTAATLKRENRMVDIMALASFTRKVTFFASTTILILAGLFTMLGAVDKVLGVFERLTFLQMMNAEMWFLRTGTLILMFMYAFFKFGWSIRQYMLAVTMLASIPDPGFANTADARSRARRTAKLLTQGSRHFNDGFRAYYFALAVMSWYLHAVLFIITTLWVVLVLYRREYRSRALAALRG